jgi:hypothetical protein
MFRAPFLFEREASLRGTLGARLATRPNKRLAKCAQQRFETAGEGAW